MQQDHDNASVSRGQKLRMRVPDRADSWRSAFSTTNEIAMEQPKISAKRFDEVLTTLEAVAGWQTERIQRPFLILGQLDGILTGIRQLRRTRPLETELIGGLRVPTLAEMARIKAWLLQDSCRGRI